MFSHAAVKSVPTFRKFQRNVLFPSSERLNEAQQDAEPKSATIKKNAVGSSETSEDTFTTRCENSKRP